MSNHLLRAGASSIAAFVMVAAFALLWSAGPADRGESPVYAAPAMQAVSASGIVTNGMGTCFPDAVLIDCDGNPIAQLKGPGGAGFFSPYLNLWVEVNGSQQTCTVGDTYISVLTIQPETNPCPGGGTPPTATPIGATQPPPPPPPPTITPTPAAPDQDSGDLAFGKPVYASTTQSGYPAEFAVDGNPDSWWASHAGRHPYQRAQNVQWIYVDLGATEQVTGMDVRWTPGRHARGYAVMVWSDRVRDWVQIGSTASGNGHEEWRVRAGAELRGRYFMLWLVNPYLSGLHYELRSWQIHGVGSGVQGGNNVALGRRVVAQSETVGMEGAAATDGDLSTAWQSDGTLPQWLYVDFGAAVAIDRAILKWMAGMHASDYGLYAWNGRDWYGIFNRRGGSGGDETATFPRVSTRYVLLHMTAAPGGAIGLREFEVYEAGSGGGSNTLPPGPPTPVPFAAANDAILGAGQEQALPLGAELLERSDVDARADRPLPMGARPDFAPAGVSAGDGNLE